jgi:phage terminase Nu1 subunit (DNA packaging protein)
MEQRHEIAQSLLAAQLTTAADHLGQIPELDRRRLSHASRMHLDLAERELHSAVALVAGGQ